MDYWKFFEQLISENQIVIDRKKGKWLDAALRKLT